MARGKNNCAETAKKNGQNSAREKHKSPPPPQFTGCAPPNPPLQYTGAAAPPPPPKVASGTFGTTSPDWFSAPRSDLSPQGARAPLYKVAPITKILLEPCKSLKSPFLVKRQSFHRPDAKVLGDLYQYTTTNTLPIWQGLKDIQKLVKDGGRMDIVCLNLAVSYMAREDAHDFRNTKCLGWRHYVDSDWAKNLLSGCSDTVVLKNLFYRGSVLYNASQSHMVFIPVFHGYHWSLYAFNMCDQKLSILDSLPDGTEGVDDPAQHHEKTRCSICDALTVTMNSAIDFRSWEYQFPKVPRQLDSCDSGFFVFNFMRLWDGHQLIQWFPIESRELRKDFLAYILLCKDKNVHLPKEVSRRIKDLPGKMMDCTLQKVAREGAALNAPSDQTIIGIDPELETSAVSSNGHILNQSRGSPAVSNAPHPPLASDFLSRCYQVTSDGDGIFHIAARFRNVSLVGDIRRTNPDLAEVLLSGVNNRGDTTLHSAAGGGSDEMVSLFLEMHHAISNAGIAKFLRAQNLKGETCLHEAVRHGHAHIVQRLISKDFGTQDLSRPTLVQTVDNEGISPLYLATTLRRIEIVRALTMWPYDQDDKYTASCAGHAGKTALHAAVVNLDKELVNILLGWNKDLTSQVDESGSTPLHFLASLSLERREPNIVLQLFYYLLPFYNIVRKYLCCKPAEDLGIVELIMEKDPLSAFYADSTGSLPVHIAAAQGRLDIVEKLLKKCPYCESSRNASGQTFLHVAVQEEKLEIVEYICGTNKFNRIINAEDQDGSTALHLAVNNASENIFCTLMRNRDVCLNFANKEGRTPLDLAFLSLHPKLICMKGPRENIFFDLLHGGGDFGICSWDRLAGNVVKPDWEKESERVGKSASMLALCAVLILNAALLAPFNVLNQKENVVVFNTFTFQTFVVFDSVAFVCSAAATYFCARAGFAMSDGSTRLKNLVTGTFSLGLAALALVCTVALALLLVLPVNTGFLPIVMAGLVILVQAVSSFLKSKIMSAFAHVRAIWARVGILRLACILLFQRSAIEPVWVVPSPSTSMFWPVAFGIGAYAYTIISTNTPKLGGGV